MSAAGGSGPAPGSAPSPLPRFAALSFTYFAAIGLFNPYAPLWFESLGYSTVLIGAIASLQAWTRVLGPYAWGWLGDHRGRRVELIRIAAAGSVLAAAGLLGVTAAVPVAVVTTLLFVANGGVVPLYEALLAQLLGRGGVVDPARYGRVRVWGSVGFIVAVTSFGALLERHGIGVFPGFVLAVNALLLVAALRLPRIGDDDDDVGAGAPVPAVWPLLRRPEVVWFFASVFFTVLAHVALYAFFSLYLVQLGYGKSAVGALWALAIALEIVFFGTQGRWFAWIGPVRWLQIVAVATVVRFALIAAGATSPWVLAVAQLLHAVTFAAHHAACIAMVHRFFPGRLRGRGQALYTTLGYGISGVLGGIGGGWLIASHGHAAAFWAASGCGVAAWLCSLRLLRRVGAR